MGYGWKDGRILVLAGLELRYHWLIRRMGDTSVASVRVSLAIDDIKDTMWSGGMRTALIIAGACIKLDPSAQRIMIDVMCNT